MGIRYRLMPQESPVSDSTRSDAKQRVKAAIDIVELVGRHLRLDRRGRLLVGLCPWHDDSRPSLQVNPERQSWKCWVCNIGGDVFSFMMQREGVDFREALQMLAEEAGISLRDHGRPVVPGSAADKQTLYKAMAWAEELYHRCLLESPEAEPARRYLQQRGIEGSSVARYRLGFAPAGWRWLADRAASTPFDAEILRTVGLVRQSERSSQDYDWFRARLMFPVHDAQGRTIAFGGRVVPGVGDPEAAKYINSPETRLFVKGDHVYGLDVVRDGIRRLGSVVVMEGYTDVIIARQFGFENVTAVLGTALRPTHLRLLRRFADRVVLLLDGDAAGQKRTSEVLQLFIAAQVDVRVATLPEGLDPADLLVQHGAEALGRVLDEAVDALQYKMRTQLAGVDLKHDLHQANVVLEELLATIALAPRWEAGGDEALRLREQQILGHIARTFMIDEAELRARLAALRNRQPSHAAPTRPPTDAPAELLHTWETELFEILVLRPDLVSVVLERVGAEDLYTPAGCQLLEVYRQLELQGRDAEPDRVLTELESPHLKHLLVDVDFRARDKPAGDWDERLSELFAAFERRRQERACRQWVSDLQSESLDERQQLELLRSLIDQQRIRQGFTAPKDG